jgi:hypothetical protein
LLSCPASGFEEKKTSALPEGVRDFEEKKGCVARAFGGRYAIQKKRRKLTFSSILKQLEFN